MPKKTRIADLLDFDYATIDSGTIIGVDEVGRGCLAGPVVAAAVILPLADGSADLPVCLADLDDSKKLTGQMRERLFAVIEKVAVCAVAEASPEEIDSINILNASLLAMNRAVLAVLEKAPADIDTSLALVDGNRKIKTDSFKQMTVVKGDSRSASIAAASVAAKVYRDRLMTELARQYPQYLWEKNKGYPSAAHRRAIGEHGTTPWHRLSFRLLKEEEPALLSEQALLLFAERGRVSTTLKD